MKTIFHEKFNKKIKEEFFQELDIADEGLYIIQISARCRSEKQIGKGETDDDDLRIEIDGRKFSQLNNPTRYFDSPAAFSGGQLHNLKKTVFFIIYFSKGKYNLTFIPDRQPILEEISVQFVGDKVSSIELNANNQAEDGDRRSWITFTLVDLPLKQIQTEIKTQRRFIDSDDVKIIIDGEIKRNLRSVFRKLWFWLGSYFKGETQVETFNLDLRQSLHYIEFHADRMPTLYKIGFDFGTETKRVPNVYDPEWTGDLKDDPEDILLARIIYGEAGDQIDEARVAVAWSIKNRIGKGNLIYPGREYNNYYDVILDPDQYAALTDPVVGPRIRDPFKTANPIEIEAWRECYKIANKVMKEEIRDPANGAIFFHDKSITSEEFVSQVPRAIFEKQIGDLFFYIIRK